jgi:hypothetical protein
VLYTGDHVDGGSPAVTATWISWSPVQRGSFRRKPGSCPRPGDVSFRSYLKIIYPHFPGPNSDHVVVVLRLIEASPCHDVVVIEKASKQGRRAVTANECSCGRQLFPGVHRPTEVGSLTSKFADNLHPRRQSARTFLLPDLENIPFKS